MYWLTSEMILSSFSELCKQQNNSFRTWGILNICYNRLKLLTDSEGYSSVLQNMFIKRESLCYTFEESC